MKYQYDKTTGQVIEKSERSNLVELLPTSKEAELWKAYRELMDDCDDIMSGREPRHSLTHGHNCRHHE
jgi:IS1 family transposase